MGIKAHIFKIGVLILFFCLFLDHPSLFSSQSQSYILGPDLLSSGGNNRSASSFSAYDTFGQSCVGITQSNSFVLYSGFIPFIQTNSPLQEKTIPAQTWYQMTTKEKAIDLDDYFESPLGLKLTYSVTGNNKIAIAIDPQTNEVSFSQPPAWFGVEKVYFIATDSEGESGYSNEVVLTVLQLPGGDFPPRINSAIPSKQAMYPGEQITIEVKVSDQNGASDIKEVFVLTNKELAFEKCLNLKFDKAVNKLYLNNDNGSDWGIGYAPGSVQILENSYVKLDCSKSSVSVSGNTLTLKLAATFKNAFNGVRGAFIKVIDSQGVYDGWSQKNEICIFRKPYFPN